MKKVGILRFPGTNCDRDIWKSVELQSMQPEWIWYKQSFLPDNYDAYVIPGGFSYGDYLRSGALAALSPAMSCIKEAAKMGKPIFGICNGFQILCEAGLLPGALMRNEKGLFIDQWVNLKLENSSQWSPFSVGQIFKMPMAHADGRFFISEEGYKQLVDKGQIWLTYADNPNGSVGNIAGVMNEAGNVVGMMPHPDRALFSWMGSEDGLEFFQWQDASGVNQ
ncbi:MAG: phosphoribosylformylglycinamidine synthase subunit PurQ [Bdellovibrionales bacterium]|nr:phosphoribosylformylglycinamidine synthase subunit PurQ [Bdellovibrionales bacterium]